MHYKTSHWEALNDICNVFITAKQIWYFSCNSLNSLTCIHIDFIHTANTNFIHTAHTNFIRTMHHMSCYWFQNHSIMYHEKFLLVL